MSVRFESFSVGTIAIHSVDRIEISKAPRKRIVSTNLNGDMLIDQTALKRTVSIHIVLCSEAELAQIEAAVAAGLSDITFYEGSQAVTISATCASFAKPAPYYLNGDRAQGVYYNDISLTWEER